MNLKGIITLIGVIGSIITIYVFVSGNSSCNTAFKNSLGIDTIAIVPPLNIDSIAEKQYQDSMEEVKKIEHINMMRALNDSLEAASKKTYKRRM